MDGWMRQHIHPSPLSCDMFAFIHRQGEEEEEEQQEEKEEKEEEEEEEEEEGLLTSSSRLERSSRPPRLLRIRKLSGCRCSQSLYRVIASSHCPSEERHEEKGDGGLGLGLAL